MLGLFKNIVKKSRSTGPEAGPADPNNTDSGPPPAIPTEFAQFYSELSPRYTLLEKIGEGAFSVVVKAVDTETQDFVAIKIIDKTNMKPEQINSVLKEISIMSKLDHKNITKLYSYQNSYSSRYCFLFLEYVSGGEIFNQIIKYTYFSEDLSRHVIRQVASAVKYLHSQGIVHRDIKPENLLFVPTEVFPRSKQEQNKARRRSDDNNKLDEGKFIPEYGSAGIGVVKLADFGLSTVLYNESMQAKTPCGTVGYTSPEQHMNLGYTRKVDMWAIGCVLYTLVVGFPPFYSATQDSKDISTKVSRGDYKFLSPWFDEVSDDCKRLIANLLIVDPDARYSIDQLLRDPWMVSGYEDQAATIHSNDTVPQTTFDEALYKKLNRTADNLADGLLAPRAEAIRLVFDTASGVQRDATPQQAAPKAANLSVLEENEPIEILAFRRRPDSDSSLSPENSASQLSDEFDEDSDFEETELTPKPYAKYSKSPSYRERRTSPPKDDPLSGLDAERSGGTSTETTSMTANEESSIFTSEIEDFSTGAKRKSSVCFQIKSCKTGSGGWTSSSLANAASSRSSSLTKSVSESHKIYPRTPQTTQFVELDDQDDELREGLENITVDDTTPVENKRPAPAKKYTVQSEPSPVFDATLSNTFDLKLTHSKILERRKINGSLKTGPEL
ncbi:hypothetical protein KL912_005190 [Ogataea haglerorum]|nr:hypothetical protein KL912_005190 [Ogataea haglerorum]